MSTQLLTAPAPSRTSEDQLQRAFASFERSAAHMVGAYRELEARAAAVDAQLERTNSTLQGVLASMPSGLVVSDPSGVVTLTNPAARQILGLDEAALLAGFAELSDVLGQPLADPGSSGAAERRVRRPDGSERVLFWTCAPTPLGGSLCVFSDVTELKRLQERERFAALGETAASLSHQVRNPLHALRGFLGLLERELADASISGAARRYLARVGTGADALERVVGGFLGLAQEQKLALEPTSAGELARRALQAVEGRGPVTLEVRGDAPLRVDALHVEQLLVNLLDNAHEASAGQPVHVHVQAQGPTVRLSVEDQGPGIAPELLPRLFQAFVSTKAHGSGLGLAYAQRIADLHGGTLRAENRPQGGARFVLELPADLESTSERKVG